MIIVSERDDSIEVMVDSVKLANGSLSLLIEKIDEMLNTEINNFVINFEKVALVDSSAIGFFLSLKKKLDANDKSLVFKNVNSDTKRLFTLLRIDKFINIEDLKE